jgi:spore coat protein U-like protein
MQRSKTMMAFKTLRLALAALLCTAALQAQAAITCTLTPTSVNVNYVSGQSTNATASGSITLNCTRLSTDATSTTYYVGIDYGTRTKNPRQVFRTGGGIGTVDQLNVNIFQSDGVTNWADKGGGQVNGTLNFSTTSASQILTYIFSVPSIQPNNNTPGIYDEIFTTNLQFTNNGTTQAIATFTTTVSITAMCFIGQVASGNTAPGAISPSTMTLNYTSFAAVAQSTAMTYTVNCTNTTPYSMDLSPSSGVLLGLAYTVKFDNGLGTKTGLIGSGFAQPYTVTAAIAAGQAGACSTATCGATQATTITVTY